MDYLSMYEKQRAYYASGATRTREFRVTALKKLEKAFKANQSALVSAMKKDMGKHPAEIRMCETGPVLTELKYCRKHLKNWMRPKRCRRPHCALRSRSYISPQPLGLTLIYSPWNYPIQMALLPLIGSLAAGNCVVLKPSSRAPETAAVLQNMLASIFPEEYVCVVTGPREETTALLDLHWDHIFYTGSRSGGTEILMTAAPHMTPCTLILRGKSPVLVDPTANIKLAARRIAYGKLLNAGQSAIAPDYLLIHEKVLDDFLVAYEKAMKKYLARGKVNHLAPIIDDEHCERLSAMLEGKDTIVYADSDPKSRRFAPVLVKNVQDTDALMQQEIFGPVLPVITWTEMDACLQQIKDRETPPALYLFTRDKVNRRRVLDTIDAGSVCVNDTMTQGFSRYLPLGGIGTSGMGSFHGKQSFDTFSHYRGVLQRKGKADRAIRNMPYNKPMRKLRLKFFS